MAKILDGSILNTIVPKMLETTDSFIINGHVHDKLTFEPGKFKTLGVGCDTARAYMNTSVIMDSPRTGSCYSDNNVIIDKYNAKYSYSIINDTNAYIITKFKTENDITVIEKIYKVSLADASIVYFSQDINKLYCKLMNGSTSSIIAINKGDIASITTTSVGAINSQLTLIKDSPLYIYYTFSRTTNLFYIGKYIKQTGAITNFYSDIGETITNNMYGEQLIISDNEIVALRSSKIFNKDNIDKVIVKKYLIDYEYEKVYSREIDLDCSILSQGLLKTWNSLQDFFVFNNFTLNDTMYFYIWHKSEKTLYLGKKMSDSQYSIIQSYELPKIYKGVLPYDQGKVLMFYDVNTVNFISFSEFEERFEQTNSLHGTFLSLGIDKNKTVWLQHNNYQVDNIGINVPTSSNAEFQDLDLEYINQDIESYVNVYTKNFNGNLVESNIEVLLSGPVVFSDTNKQIKKIRTTSNAVTRIPVKITCSGTIEVNAFIL